MKKVALNLMGLALLAMVFGACNDDDETPEVNLIIGEWVAAEGQFMTLTVDGDEKSLLEFGMEVLKFNEMVAEEEAKKYLKSNFLGPIDVEEPKLLFSLSDKLIADLSGEQIEGKWELINNRTVLNLGAPDLYWNGFSFDVKKLTANELYLDLEWKMFYSYGGEDVEPYNVGLIIKLVK